MTLLTKPIRQRIEDIIINEYSISDPNYTIPFGIFSLSLPDAETIEETISSASDRQVEILSGPILPVLEVNHIDNFGLYYSEFVIKVSYNYTHLGNNLEEVLIANSGDGYLKSINDRANSDKFNIAKVLTHYEAFGGVTPEVYKVEEVDFNLSIENDKVISELTLRIEFEASLALNWWP